MKTRFSTTTKKLGNRHRSAVCARKNAVPTRLKPMQLSIGGSGRRGWPQSLGTASTADGTRPMKREERDSRARRLRGPPAPHRPQPPADRSSSMTRRCGSRRSRRDAPPKGFFCFIILASGNRGIIGPSPHLQPMQLARDWSIPFLGLVLVLVGLLLGTVCFLIPSSRLYGPFDPDSFSQSLHSWCVVAPIEWIKNSLFLQCLELTRFGGEFKFSFWFEFIQLSNGQFMYGGTTTITQTNFAKINSGIYRVSLHWIRFYESWSSSNGFSSDIGQFFNFGLLGFLGFPLVFKLIPAMK